jgi:hypothetical protein
VPQSSLASRAGHRYHAPSKSKGRENWEPNLDYFSRQFDGHPERLKNLHFAFVVLLRALARASPHLAVYPYSAGVSLEEDAKTTALVRSRPSHNKQSDAGTRELAGCYCCAGGAAAGCRLGLPRILPPSVSELSRSIKLHSHYTPQHSVAPPHPHPATQHRILEAPDQKSTGCELHRM